MLNVHHEACGCLCQCVLSLGPCCRLSSIIAASIITLSGRNEKFAYENKMYYLLHKEIIPSF